VSLAHFPSGADRHFPTLLPVFEYRETKLVDGVEKRRIACAPLKTPTFSKKSPACVEKRPKFDRFEPPNAGTFYLWQTNFPTCS
jgi:hypothetical protein